MTTEAAPPLSEGRYRLLDPLGTGGMAAVYRGFDTRLQVYRAIKILLPALSNRPKLRARFEAEARTMALLEHRNIVRVYDVGVDGNRAYIVMELVEGGSLLDRIEKRGPLHPRQAVDVSLDILAALSVAHSHGVVHRDIKPHNVLLTADHEVRVTDFGIARLNQSNRDNLTKTGSVMGTWAFMAPEQRSDAKNVDERADLYAVAATLYTALTQETPMDLFAAELDRTMLKDLPEALSPVIRTATCYDRDQRYASSLEMSEALTEARERLDPAPPDLPPLALPSEALPAAPPPAAHDSHLSNAPGGASASPAAEGAQPTAIPTPSGGQTFGDLAPDDSASQASSPPPPVSPTAAGSIVEDPGSEGFGSEAPPTVAPESAGAAPEPTGATLFPWSDTGAEASPRRRWWPWGVGAAVLAGATGVGLWIGAQTLPSTSGNPSAPVADAGGDPAPGSPPPSPPVEDPSAGSTSGAEEPAEGDQPTSQPSSQEGGEAAGSNTSAESPTSGTRPSAPAEATQPTPAAPAATPSSGSSTGSQQSGSSSPSAGAAAPESTEPTGSTESQTSASSSGDPDSPGASGSQGSGSQAGTASDSPAEPADPASRLPELHHTPVSHAPLGEPLTISATITRGEYDVTLYYRPARPGVPARRKMMVERNGTYTATLVLDDEFSRGMVYHIAATPRTPGLPELERGSGFHPLAVTVE